jgi:hypothetical protein
METLTIKANYTDTIENLTFFAMSKGWTPTIKETQVIEDVSTEIEIENPITLDMFCASWAKEVLLGAISQPILAYVDQMSQEQVLIQKRAYLERLEGNLEVVTE